MKKYVIGVIVLLALVATGYKAAQDKAKPVTVTKPVGSIVALGDSVAAGVGLKDAADASACDRTTEAYAAVGARTLNYSLTNLACTQATIPVGIIGSQTINQLALSPQLSELFKQSKPDVITLTIGANDANWIEAISKCFTGVCGSEADTAVVNARLATLTLNLKLAIGQIQSHYVSAKPKIIVTGYYNLFPATVPADCSDATGLTQDEVAWIRAQLGAISTAIKAGLPTESNVRYVQPNLGGHELCTPDPYVQGIGSGQVYHPTAEGQAMIAKLIVAEAKK